MSLGPLVPVMIQVPLALLVLGLALMANLPWFEFLILVILVLIAVCPNLPLYRARALARTRAAVGLAWLCTGLAPLLMLAGRIRSLEGFLDEYYAVLAWAIGAVVALAARKPAMRLQSLAWFSVGSVIWLATAYWRNQPGSFYLGLLLCLLPLIASHFWLRLPLVGSLAVNTGILLLLALPLTDLLFSPPVGLGSAPAVRKEFYSYQAARKDPAAFARWWDYYVTEWKRLEAQILVPDPTGGVPWRLRANSSALLVQCPIRINSRGFRGPEISREKGSAYRVVVIGESTTFGVTLNPEDRPWPELLEELINARLKPARRVQVINAGVPGYRLDDNLRRFSTDILPLEPDMVISYHGINGFPSLHPALPSTLADSTPVYRRRPLRLLAACENRLRIAAFRQRVERKLVVHPPTIPEPMATGYADAYRRLVALARTNHFRLVLANFSMAANRSSPPDVLAFYRAGYPGAPWQIKANEAHSTIIDQVSAAHPEVCRVDTHPALDGDPENFLDLVHFAPPGERQMAENMFAGIGKLLEEDLAARQPGTSAGTRDNENAVKTIRLPLGSSDETRK